jgi:HlyD family secretion protein
MINNSPARAGRLVFWLAMLPAAAGTVSITGCEPKPKHPGAFQGVIEFDERVLGFETAGRVIKVLAVRGAEVGAGDVLATLDDTLERTVRESREAEALAARADLSLVRAGTRPEQIRSMEAELRASQANETLLQKNAARERSLLEKGAVAQASVDDLESRLAAATAERQSLEQRLRELVNGARKEQIASAEARAAAADRSARVETERVNRHDLNALAPGRILEVHVEPGEVVAVGTPVVTVADTSHPYADVFVPQGNLDGVRVGAGAAVTVDANPEPFRARVEDVGRRTEFTPRYLFSERERPNLVVRVRVRIEDPAEKLHAGVPTFVTLDKAP